MPHGKPWVDARTLRELGECTALWLERQAPHRPTRAFLSHVSDELASLAPLLTVLNRTGEIVVDTAQPACTPDDRRPHDIMERQRAAFMAFVAPQAIERVRRALTLEGVELRVAAPGSPSEHSMLLVSRNKGRDITWFGYVLSPGDIAQNYGGVPGERKFPGLHANVIRALQQCYQVTAVDQEWGRNTVLWPALQRLI